MSRNSLLRRAPDSRTFGEQAAIELTPKALEERLILVFRAPDYQPPVLPRTAVELLDLSRKPEVPINAIAQVLERDPMLAASVLRVAQSAVYSRGAPLHSLAEAIVRLGLGTVRDIFFQVTMSSRVFRAPGYEEPMAKMMRHSTATAHLARFVSQRSGSFDTSAFLCGLLHDAGIAAAMVTLSELPRDVKPVGFTTAWQAIVDIHAEAGQKLCELWRLPADVGDVLAQHHGPRAGVAPHPLAATVAVAESFAEELGFGLSSESRGNDHWALEALGIDDIARNRLLAGARMLMQELKL